ncbi:hypothetical protein [Paraburkholderia hospita]|uniref:hypothetical protein n=1 Tax=Paraburkholderia hospita TaxID=169430 RepID=UPI0008A73FCD|nr:hypothetical protein [Paraburkholderia hospita]SEI14443.1 hypothetical protein SAMN05192544_102533 [Paraburkholderia hospita]
MSEHDHFAATLDDPVADEHNGAGHGIDDAADIHTIDDDAPTKKRSVPTPVIMIGGTLVVMACVFGYKHFIKPKPNTQFASASVSSLPADTGGMMQSSPLPASVPVSAPLPPQGASPDAAQGSVAPLSPQPSQQATAMPVGPLPTTVNGQQTPNASSLPVDTGASSPDLAANVAQTIASSPSGIVPAPASSAPASGILANANAVTANPAAPATSAPATTPDDKDAEIRKLKRELKVARDALSTHRGVHSNARSTVVARADSGDDTPAAADSQDTSASAPAKNSVVHARHTGKRKQPGVEVQLGYHIKQVIPGQGWIEDEETGKQRVVTVGDKIGAAEVTRIDADNYKIYTTAGVIQ